MKLKYIKKEYLLFLLLLLSVYFSWQFPDFLESNYSLAFGSRSELTYSVFFLVRGLFALVNIIFINIALLVLIFKVKPW